MPSAKILTITKMSNALIAKFKTVKNAKNLYQKMESHILIVYSVMKHMILLKNLF